MGETRTRPGYNGPRFEARQALDAYEAPELTSMVAVGGRPYQAKSVREPVVRVC